MVLVGFECYYVLEFVDDERPLKQSPCPILMISNAKLRGNKHQFCKSLVLLSRNHSSRPFAWEAFALTDLSKASRPDRLPSHGTPVRSGHFGLLLTLSPPGAWCDASSFCASFVCFVPRCTQLVGLIHYAFRCNNSRISDRLIFHYFGGVVSLMSKHYIT